MAKEFLSKGGADGTCLAQSATDKFHLTGGTPVVCPTGVGATSTTVGGLTNSSALSLCVSAVQDLQTRYLAMRTALINIGAIVGD